MCSYQKEYFFKKVAVIHGKGEFAKRKGNISNIPVEADAVCIKLPWPANNNGLVLAKLKSQLRYQGYVYFEPVRPSAIMKLWTISKEKTTFIKIFSFLMV